MPCSAGVLSVTPPLAATGKCTNKVADCCHHDETLPASPLSPCFLPFAFSWYPLLAPWLMHLYQCFLRVARQLRWMSCPSAYGMHMSQQPWSPAIPPPGAAFCLGTTKSARVLNQGTRSGPLAWLQLGLQGMRIVAYTAAAWSWRSRSTWRAYAKHAYMSSHVTPG